eukprot:TRINITY_DN1064_c1_g1_i4.p1 TRINITY_DN1064_c1_g1~~TRINITY_DN1064_c1_g1_i4.p1  ORF type:complete len:692 (-),score=153.96 TRINITY_DN1064_c1_g1_i4:4235-6055(-)
MSCSPDALFDCVDSWKKTLMNDEVTVELTMSHSSVFGSFVKTVVVWFSEMDFDGRTELYSRLCVYFEGQTADPLGSLQSSSLRRYVKDKVFSLEENEANPESALSLCMEIQSECREEHFVHFLKYVACVKAKDYHGAVEAIHLYFDSSLVHEPEFRKNYHYAVLNLALLHYSFGHIDASKEAVLEAIRIAQQVSDTDCLSQAVVLLYRIMLKAGDSAAAAALLQKCVADNSDDRITRGWIPMISYVLNHFGNEFTPGSLKSRVEQCLESAMLSTLINPDLSSKVFGSTVSKLLMLDSNAWSLFRLCRPSEANADLQMQLMDWPDFKHSLDRFSFILHQAGHLLDSGKISDSLTQLGRVKDELVVHLSDDLVDQILLAEFSTAFSLFGLLVSQIPLIFCFRNDNLAAEARLARLKTRLVDETSDFAFEVFVADVLLKILKKNFSGAFLTVREKMYPKIKFTPVMQVRMRLMLYNICQLAGFPLKALPYVLEAVSLSSDQNLVFLRAESLLALARIQLVMLSIHECLSSCEEIIPLLLERSRISLVAESYALQLACWMHLGNKNGQDGYKVRIKANVKSLDAIFTSSQHQVPSPAFKTFSGLNLNGTD